jgi:hypothetical protein
LSTPPPACARLVNQLPLPGTPLRRSQPQRIALIGPSCPAWIVWCSAATSGRKRLTKPTISSRPLRSAAATIASASFRLIAIGFSHSTCSPASSAAMLIDACR